MRHRMSNSSDFLIIADGEPLTPKRLRFLSRNRFVICLDGAANELIKRKIWPHIVLGDMDSIIPRVRKKFEARGIPMLAYSDQQTTDLEKALLYCKIRRAKSVAIAGAIGKRSDHTIANFSYLRKYFSKSCSIVLFTENEQIIFLKNDGLQFKKKAKTVSIFGFPRATVSSSGLQYELKKLQLSLGKCESVSNTTKMTAARIRVNGEALVILEE